MQQTRGVAGFYYNEPMLIYQNENAEPEKLGVKILREFKGYNLKQDFELVSEFSLMDLTPVKGAEPATGYHKQRFRRHLPSELVREDATTLYDLFKPLQGTLKPYLDGLVNIYPDDSHFIKDSHFCKWGYVLNVDDKRFDILRGDQTKNEDEKPIYGIAERQDFKMYHLKDTPYNFCSIVQSYDVGDLPSEEQFLKDLEKFRL